MQAFVAMGSLPAHTTSAFDTGASIDTVGYTASDVAPPTRGQVAVGDAFVGARFDIDVQLVQLGRISRLRRLPLPAAPSIAACHALAAEAEKVQLQDPRLTLKCSAQQPASSNAAGPAVPSAAKVAVFSYSLLGVKLDNEVSCRVIVVCTHESLLEACPRSSLPLLQIRNRVQNCRPMRRHTGCCVPGCWPSGIGTTDVCWCKQVVDAARTSMLRSAQQTWEKCPETRPPSLARRLTAVKDISFRGDMGLHMAAITFVTHRSASSCGPTQDHPR